MKKQIIIIMHYIDKEPCQCHYTTWKNSNIIWIGGQAFFTNIKLQPDQAREGESLYNCNVIESDDFLIPPLIIKVVGTSEAKQRHEKITARKISFYLEDRFFFSPYGNTIHITHVDYWNKNSATITLVFCHIYHWVSTFFWPTISKVFIVWI